MTLKITGALFKEMVINAASFIGNRREEINELNVFPVPDGDTGTNMSMTVGSAAAELGKSTPGTVTRAADITANAMLRGARGNSGVITSLLFRGIAKYMKGKDSVDAPAFAGAMATGVESAYKAVMKPAEGTILTVSRLASDAAVSAAKSVSDIEQVLEAAIKRGYEALADTVNQNPVLKKAGVIDAGGKGYLYVLEGMLLALRGEKVAVVDNTAPAVQEKADFTGFETEDITFTYCTEFIVSRKTKKSPDVLRSFLDIRGDSIVVVDDDEIIKVHVHTNEPGVVLTEALTYGPLLTVKIENMRQQHTQKVIEAEQPKHALNTPHAVPENNFGVVAVCTGAGLAKTFRDLGADVVVTGGQTMNPSTQDIAIAVNATPAKTVFVLPNNKNIIMAAEQCAGLITDKRIVVIPTTSVPQGLSAMLSLDQDGQEDEIAEGMRQAASGVHTVSVTYAARESVFDGISIKAGEYLVLLENTLLATGPSLEDVTEQIASRLAEFDPEFVTVYTGEDATEEMADCTLRALEKAMPDAECSVAPGGQAVYCMLISAE